MAIGQRIVTRGFGKAQLLATRGYGRLELVEEVVQFRQKRKGRGPDVGKPEPVKEKCYFLRATLVRVNAADLDPFIRGEVERCFDIEDTTKVKAEKTAQQITERTVSVKAKLKK